MLAVAILIVGVFSRLVLHAPNFTPVIALALFGGVYLKKRQALYVPIALLAVTDLFLGLHPTMPFTWGSILVISAIGIWLRSRKTTATVLGSSLFSAILFVVVTNFGAWLTMYPHTAEGLRNCYIAAIPFFRNTLLSTLVYSAVTFGLYELIAQRVRNTRFSALLLSA
jgi:hypothetical protein